MGLRMLWLLHAIIPSLCLHACCTLTLFLYFLALQSLHPSNILVKMFLHLFHWFLLCVATHINLLTFVQSSTSLPWYLQAGYLAIVSDSYHYILSCTNIAYWVQQRVQLPAIVSRSKKRSNVAKKDNTALETAAARQTLCTQLTSRVRHVSKQENGV